MHTRLRLSALAMLAVLASCGDEESPVDEAPPVKERVDAGSAALDARVRDERPRGEVADAGALDPTPPVSGQPSYAEHVRPILTRACVSCHSEGQIGPFALDSYERAQTFAKLVAKSTRARKMPPSVIDNSGGCNTFPEIPWLSDEEIGVLEQWAGGDAQEGDMSLPEPARQQLPQLSGEIRTLKTPAYTPSTDKLDDYRCFVIDSPFPEKTFVTGFDTRPGDKKTAHHMVVFYPLDDLSGAFSRVLDELDEGPGYDCFGAPGVAATVIAAWAPGGGATLYPDDLGIEVQPGRPLIVQMHYNTAASAMPGQDSTEVDLAFQKDGIAPGAFINMLDLDMTLPPGQTLAEEVVSDSIAASHSALQAGPVKVYGIFPHMHELGRTLRVTATDAAGAETCMVDVPRWDFNWQRMYFFEQPLTIDAKATIKVHCGFDTTTRTEATHWGEGTQDEMCVAGLFVKL